MNTHARLVEAIDKAEGKAVIPMLGWIVAVLAIAILSVETLPFNVLGANQDNFLPNILKVSSDLEYLGVAAWAIGAGAIFVLVVGILTATEFRSFLGAGITRTALWSNARKSAIGFSFLLTLVISVTLALTLALDGAFGEPDWWRTALLLLAVFAGYWALHEFGYYQGFMWVRFGLIPGLLTTIPITIFTVFMVNLVIRGHYWAFAGIAVVLLINLIGTYRAALTLPMRRNS